MCFNFKDFLNADANCPGYVIMAFEMIEMLKNQGSKGTLNIFIKLVNQGSERDSFFAAVTEVMATVFVTCIRTINDWIFKFLLLFSCATTFPCWSCLLYQLF